MTAVRCFECLKLLDSRAAVHLTKRTAVCQRCNDEMHKAYEEELEVQRRKSGTPAYVPDPKELRERAEAQLEKVRQRSPSRGSARPDSHYPVVKVPGSGRRGDNFRAA